MVLGMMRNSDYEETYRRGSGRGGHSRGSRHRVRDVGYDSGSRAGT
jgi:hypothetical protein